MKRFAVAPEDRVASASALDYVLIAPILSVGQTTAPNLWCANSDDLEPFRGRRILAVSRKMCVQRSG